MLLLFVGGVMNLIRIAALTILVVRSLRLSASVCGSGWRFCWRDPRRADRCRL